MRIAINYWNTQWGGEKHTFFIDRQSSPEICIQLNEDGRKTYQIKNIFIKFSMYEIWYNQLIRRSIIGWFSKEGWRKWMMNFIFLRTARAYLVIMKKYNLLWKRSECYIENFQRCARPFVKKFTRKSTTNIRTPPIPCGPDLRW